MTPFFSTTGTHKKDYYLVNGSPDFAVIPAGKINNINQAMPIRLPYGDKKFGAVHILERHGQWVFRNESSGCVATLLWKKLSQRGSIHLEENDKLNIFLKVNPSCLVVLKQQQGFYSVTTLYGKEKIITSQMVCAYEGRHWANFLPSRPLQPFLGTLTT